MEQTSLIGFYFLENQMTLYNYIILFFKNRGSNKKKLIKQLKINFGTETDVK